ncbi:hypothetical protein AVEN_224735-1 [Araneus ventricosus]|uniref:Uncharacterized protein n=1 Tax=Araneus ventricosus TaxID=182803 RepID=A0A4Y2HWY8_ARAVE|nr:hypothetical protein AVEN_224735-1 [Araneus ventricosus]
MSRRCVRSTPPVGKVSDLESEDCRLNPRFHPRSKMYVDLLHLTFQRSLTGRVVTASLPEPVGRESHPGCVRTCFKYNFNNEFVRKLVCLLQVRPGDSLRFANPFCSKLVSHLHTCREQICEKACRFAVRCKFAEN